MDWGEVQTMTQKKSSRSRFWPFFHLTNFFICALGASVTLGQQGVLGDRLVTEINNIPYTQRQVETYLFVKEALRKNEPGQGISLVNSSNWQMALDAFSEDMLIQQ